MNYRRIMQNLHEIIMNSINDYENKYGERPHRINLSKPAWEHVNDTEIRENFKEVITIQHRDVFISFTSLEKEKYKNGNDSPIPLHFMNVWPLV